MLIGSSCDDNVLGSVFEPLRPNTPLAFIFPLNILYDNAAANRGVNVKCVGLQTRDDVIAMHKCVRLIPVIRKSGKFHERIRKLEME